MTPECGFPPSEYQNRLRRAQALMAKADNSALKESRVLTLEPAMDIKPARFVIHGENIVITADGAANLSPVTPVEIRGI